MDHSHTRISCIHSFKRHWMQPSFPFHWFPPEPRPSSVFPLHPPVFGFHPSRLFHMLLNTRGKLVAPRRSFEYKSTRGQQQQQRNNNIEPRRKWLHNARNRCFWYPLGVPGSYIRYMVKKFGNRPSIY